MRLVMVTPRRIATWNINGLNARLDFVKHWLEARNPDLVGLQELKVADDKFPRLEFEALGYSTAAHGQKSWNGVAVLAKKELGELELTTLGLPGQKALGSRLITTRVGGLTFCTVYCPNGKTISHEDYEKKLLWFDDLIDYVQTWMAPDEAAVLCGDFNLCPQGIDSWNEQALKGHLFHTDAERERYRALKSWGFVDLYRQLNPGEQSFSWWDYRAGAFHKNQGLRIDVILGTSSIAERAKEAWIDRDYRKKKDGMIASDHAPVILDLE